MLCANVPKTMLRANVPKTVNEKQFLFFFIFLYLFPLLYYFIFGLFIMLFISLAGLLLIELSINRCVGLKIRNGFCNLFCFSLHSTYSNNLTLLTPIAGGS